MTTSTMTKPHEETWIWDDERKVIATGVRDFDVEDDGSRIIVETDSGCYPPRGAERQLIAQAPAMARVLLRLVDEVESGRNDLGDCMTQELRFAVIATLRAAGIELPPLTGDWSQ